MGTLLTTASQLSCPHGGTVIAIPAAQAVSAGGDPVVTVADTFMVAGCSFVPVAPSPCVLVQWMTGAASSTVNSAAPLTTDSIGMCQAATGAVQGPVIIQSTQPAAQAI